MSTETVITVGAAGQIGWTARGVNFGGRRIGVTSLRLSLLLA